MKRIIRGLLIKLAAIFFIVYSAYNVFVVIKGITWLPLAGIIISLIVALMFAVLAVFALTAGIKTENIGFLMARRLSFIIALFVLFALKIRMAGSVFAYVDFSKPYTLMYAGSYIMLLAAMAVLLFYYAFIVRRLPFFPRASVILPLIVLILFVCSFTLEILLFSLFGVYTEASPLRTAVSRPLFYLGFICLSAYFLFPPDLEE